MTKTDSQRSRAESQRRRGVASGGWPLAAVLLTLSACSGSDSESTPMGLQTEMDATAEPESGVGDDEPADAAGNTLSEPTSMPTGEIDALASDALYLDDQSRCSLVGEDVSFSVRARSPGQPRQPESDPGVSGFVTLVQTLGDSAELVSRTDDQIVLQLMRPDIVAITAQTQTSSVTGYFSAIEADAPASVIQRKVIPDGCLYSLRMPGYCATVLSKNGQVRVGRDDVFIAVDGCELDNPERLPVRELPAAGS